MKFREKLQANQAGGGSRQDSNVIYGYWAILLSFLLSLERTKLECNCTKSTTQSVGIRSNLGRDLVGMYMLGEAEEELIPLGGVNVGVSRDTSHSSTSL